MLTIADFVLCSEAYRNVSVCSVVVPRLETRVVPIGFNGIFVDDPGVVGVGVLRSSCADANRLSRENILGRESSPTAAMIIAPLAIA